MRFDWRMENGNGGWNARPRDGESLANLVKWLVLTDALSEADWRLENGSRG
jgi:hypothetical protein